MQINKLYKYQNIDQYSLNNLINNVIYFNNPESLNDPFDTNLLPNFDRMSISKLKKRFEKYKKKGFCGTFYEYIFEEQNISKKIYNEKIPYYRKNTGVACFTENLDNLIMWAHYAEKHKGFCLEFDCMKYTLNEFIKNKKLFKVKYHFNYPDLDPLDIFQSKENEDESNLNFFQILLSNKSAHWAYEKEWRWLHEKAGTEYYYSPKSLRSIYLGVNIKECDKVKIIDILKNNPTKIYQMKMARTSYKLEPELVNT